MNLMVLPKMGANYSNFDTKGYYDDLAQVTTFLDEVCPKVTARLNYEFLRRLSARFTLASSQNFTVCL